MTESIQTTLSILPSSKEEIKTFSNLLLAELDNGNAQPLAVLKTFKAFEKVFETIKSDLTKKCLSEADKYPKGKFSSCGIEFEIMEAGTKYDYASCNDFEYNMIKEQIDRLTVGLKAREAFLKALSNSMDLTDESTGEIHRVHPPVKSSTTTLKTIF